MGGKVVIPVVQHKTISRDVRPLVQHLTAEELGARLRMPTWSVYQLVKTGQIKALRIGRRVRFRLEDVQAWEAAGGAPVKRRSRKAAKKRR